MQHARQNVPKAKRVAGIEVLQRHHRGAEQVRIDLAAQTVNNHRFEIDAEAKAMLLGGLDVTEALRLEEVGAMASKVSAWPRVRTALRELQLSFRQVPGLVADGRDMGTVIFPGADLKVFLTASAATRAERRFKQLISKGISANIDSLRAELEARDARDQTRSVSPLKPAVDATLLDNSALTVQTSVDAVFEVWRQRRPFG